MIGGSVNMKKNCTLIILGIFFTIVFGFNINAEEKLAQSGFQFLSVGQDARAVAMGDAHTTMEGMSNALFYNPAGIARITSMVDISANMFTFIADIKHLSFSGTYSPLDGQYGVVGFSLQAVDYGSLEPTMVWANPDGFIDLDNDLNPSALSVGLGYGRQLSEKFVVGGQIKYVTQYLGENMIPGEGMVKNVAGAVSFDFGTIYHTGFESLVFGMSVRNFSEEIKYEEEGFQLPLTFKIGISANLFDFALPGEDEHQLMFLVDAVHPRSHAEYLNVGMEYEYLNSFAVRLGYVSGQDETDISYGLGLKQFGFGVDYAYTPFGVFDDLHRFTLHFSY
jgi:hypothetical protein